MGLYGPLIVYQVLSRRKATDAKNLQNLKDVAAEIELLGEGLGRIEFGPDYIGNRSHLYCDASGEVTVIPEKARLHRTVLFQKISQNSITKVGILTSDTTSFFDCDPFVSTALAYLNARFVLQVFSLKNPQVDRAKPTQQLTQQRLFSAADGNAAFHMMADNSQSCQAVSLKVLKKNVNKFGHDPLIRSIDWNGDVQTVVPKIMAQWHKIAMKVEDTETSGKNKKVEYIQF